jgi:hypothetical protein
MALTTYSELQASIAGWLVRSDLTAVIPDFIALCEADLRTRLKTKHTSILQATLTAGDTQLSLPAALLRIESIAFSGSLLGSALSRVSHETLLAERQHHTAAGVPRYCAVVGDVVEFCPTPSAAYTVDIEVEGPFVPLSIAAPTNWLLTDYPQVYLFGALRESALYLQDDAREQLWAARYEAALAKLAVAAETWGFSGALSRKLSRVFG